ncbi:MAG: DUF3365 domain-containing protein [Myxococcota bacterium]
MRSKALRLAMVMCAAAAVTWASACKPSVDEKAAAERGAAALAPFKKNLMGALKAGMAVGPVSAVEACHLSAPGMPAAASTPEVTVGRTTDKLRNPENAPKPWMKPLLADYAKAGPGAAPRAVALEDGKVGYVEPIYLQEMCLACHGSTLNAEVATTLAERYPKDEAKGYAAGDFRGLFWVEMAGR